MAHPHQHSTVVAEAAARINSPRGLDETLQAIVEAARSSLPCLDHVGVTLVSREHSWETAASTDALVDSLDDLQYGLRQGPCVDALSDSGPGSVVVEHARHEARWHDYIPEAVRQGLRSQMAVRLTVGEHGVGGLNLYSTSNDVIDDECREMACLFATHAALAIGHARQVEDLHRAIDSHTLVGQAVGIAMERYGLGSGAAFDYLVRLSATSERKLRVVAEELVAGTDRERA